MTVEQLIAELQKQPSHLRVIVDGYEGGYCEVDAPVVREIALNVHEEWYYGPHEDVDGYGVRDHAKDNAVLLGRKE